MVRYKQRVYEFDIIMKFILKGKQFLSKKLQQLDIATDNLDLISEQIPGRLKQPLKVLQSSQIDLDSNQSYESYFKNYPNHHISHYLLQKLNMSIETNTLAPEYHPPSDDPDLFIPNFNKPLERRALLLKQVVDEYDEGYHKIEEPVICMAVIHFHHKRGTEIQYRYPQTKTVEDIENLVVHHAMPDSSHNKMEDYNFFNFQAVVKGRKRMLFGVSYFKQIKVTEQMKAQNNEITRSYMQKALAIVSTLPLFGYLKMRLSSTIKVFFADFNNYELITAAYKDLNKNLMETWPRLEMNQLYIGSDLKVIINLFGVQEFYQIWKAVLYQKRVVIFAHSSSSASSFIISLLTLFPGLSTFGIFSKPISKYMQSLRQYALPLRTFSTDNFMAMSFHIQDFHLLSKFQKSNKGSFLLGTTNRLLKQANDYGIEMLINLENCTIEKKKPRVPWEPLSKIQKSFIAEIQQIIKKQKTLAYEGSEDMIRNKFHNFLKLQLIGIMKANQKLKDWMQKCREYEVKGKDKGKEKKQELNYQQMLQQDNQPLPRKKSQDFPPLIPHQVTNIPFPGLLLTKSFPYFLQFHNQKIPQIMEHKVIPSFIIQNYEYCLQLSEDEFIIYNWHQNKLSFGRGRPARFEGKEIKFISQTTQKLRAKYVYIGQVDNYKYNKNGFYLDKNQLYEGQYQNGVKEGYGKLTNSIHKYIGNFRNNLYDGSGQLVTGKDIYVGEFKEGMRNGSGKNQGDLQYDGEWLNNKPHGNGIMKIGDNQFMGRFKNGAIDQQNQYTIRYESGNLYKGKVKDKKPEGKGFFIDQNGTRFMFFKNGEPEYQILQNGEGQKQQDQTQITKNELLNTSEKQLEIAEQLKLEQKLYYQKADHAHQKISLNEQIYQKLISTEQSIKLEQNQEKQKDPQAKVNFESSVGDIKQQL